MAVQLPLLAFVGGAAAGAILQRAFRDSRLWVYDAPRGYSTYRGGHYCGPGWGFTRQDVEDGTIARLPQAIDAIDEACRHHDQCYADHGWFKQACNVRLAMELTTVVLSQASTEQQRVDAAVMAAVFATEAVRVDPWLRPLSRVYLATKELWAAIKAEFQGSVRMNEAMERAVHSVHGVPR